MYGLRKMCEVHTMELTLNILLLMVELILVYISLEFFAMCKLIHNYNQLKLCIFSCCCWTHNHNFEWCLIFNCSEFTIIYCYFCYVYNFMSLQLCCWIGQLYTSMFFIFIFLGWVPRNRITGSKDILTAFDQDCQIAPQILGNHFTITSKMKSVKQYTISSPEDF